MDVKEDLKLIISAIRNERESKKLTKTELAVEALNAKANYITQLENDLTKFSKLTYKNFSLICKTLNVEPISILNRIKASRSKGYLMVRGKDAFLKESTKRPPAPVYRNGTVLDYNDVNYFSLLDVKGEEQDIVTDFQIVLSYWHPNSKSKRHYQLGEEFLLTIDGIIKYTFLDDTNISTISPKSWSKSLTLKATTESSENNFIFLNGWYPHQAETDNKGAKSIIVTYDPRGESGLHTYKAELIEKGAIILDEDRLSYQSLIRGLGIKIKMARLKSGLTSSTIASRVGLKSAADLYKIENYLVDPKLETVLMLAKNLDIELSELFPNNTPPISYGNIKNTKKGKEDFFKYDNLEIECFIDYTDHSNTSVSDRKLKIYRVTKSQQSNNVEPKDYSFDIAFVVLKGFFSFSISEYDEGNDLEVFSKMILTELDTVYIEKYKRHHFEAYSDDAEALIIYLDR